MKTPGTIIKNPRITEKATTLVENRAYTFDVAKNATKKEIEKAIKTLYKVTPEAVRTVKIPTKKVYPRGRRGNVGSKGGGKKAYVYLKKGDKIEVL
jgi:large subunit ribosomal protein L23